VREEIPRALDGERVDRAVALLSGLTRAEVSALVEAGAVRLDGVAVASRGRRVRQGQTLAADLPERAAPIALLADPNVELSVVYEDADLLVVDKPAGLVVHPGAANSAATMVHGLLARYPDLAAAGGGDERPGVVHRLDKGTSGLLVVARRPAARQALVAELAARRVRRRYLALCHGLLAADRGAVEAPIGRSARDPTRMAVVAAGRPALTRYQVQRRADRPAEVSLLRLELDTGRTHQIRVHLAAIGHPVVGDERYGQRAPWRPLASGRVFLHAAHLGFVHPTSGVELSFDSPLPADLEAVVDLLGTAPGGLAGAGPAAGG